MQKRLHGMVLYCFGDRGLSNAAYTIQYDYVRRFVLVLIYVTHMLIFVVKCSIGNILFCPTGADMEISSII